MMATNKPALPADTLLEELRSLIETARLRMAHAANATLTMLYWHVGQRISKEVLRDGRAEYGAQVVATVSQQLMREYGKGFNASALTRMVKFAEL
jgi:hypothetical protein